MTEPEEEGQGPVDEKVPAYVKSIMESVPEEDIRSIVEQAAALHGQEDMRLQVAAQTGIALGVELTFRDMYDAYDMALSGTIAAVEKLDEMMNASDDKDLILALASIRNPMAKVIDACTNTVSADERIQGVLAAFGMTEECCLQPLGEVGEYDTHASGLMAYNISRKWPEMFQAYVLFRNDETLPCRCPWHIRMALHELPVDEAIKAFDKVMDQYPPSSIECTRMVQEFVQWWVNCARRSYSVAAAGGEEELKPQLVSEAESRLVANDFFSKLGVGVKKT